MSGISELSFDSSFCISSLFVLCFPTVSNLRTHLIQCFLSPLLCFSPSGISGLSSPVFLFYVFPLSGISGLSFDSIFLSPVVLFYLVLLLILLLSVFC